MGDMERVLACWRALDARFERSRPTRWGAVVTDHRFPSIHDVNYARIDRARPIVRLADVEGELHDDLVRVGARNVHVVLFEPERATGLLAEASRAGARLTWEIVMTRTATPVDSRDDVRVAEVPAFDLRFRRAFRRSARELGATHPRVAEELEAIEAEVLIPAGKRWFVVRESGRAVAFGSLLVLAEAALIDHVVTLPAARRRGYADAIVRRLCNEAYAAGASIGWLLTDPKGDARRLYERLGFREVATIASTLRPFDASTLRTRPGRSSPARSRGSRTMAR